MDQNNCNTKKKKYQKVWTVVLNNRKGRTIKECPEEVQNQANYGHWEMDSVVGSSKMYLWAMTEWKTRKELIFKMKSKIQQCVIAGIDKLEWKHGNKFGKIFKSITMNNGEEFLDMAGLERSCINQDKQRTTCYYTNPYSVWECGSNGVANKLIWRFTPKGSNIDKLTKKGVKRIERWMNNYPRRIFGYWSANQIATQLN